MTTLHGIGLQAEHRVAVVLRNGPEMAAAFLGIGSVCAVAPFNPSYRAEELEPLMRDIGVSALVFEETTRSPSVDVARAMGIETVELVADSNGPAGQFDLVVNHKALSRGGGPNGSMPGPNDVVLLLHTSGTTARPKIVPLTHSNMVASATNIAASLSLGPDDVCLNVMPLFHIHGLLAALVSTLSVGGSVAASAGFNAFSFFKWMEEIRPTWYTAVPSMHQAILSRADEHVQAVAAMPLKFLRSSSSALPSTVFDELEGFFDVPVIEAYGMTEACHQISTNPLPPGLRKRGTVGLPFGTEIALLGEDGSLLSDGAGEILVKGQNVIRGYEGVPAGQPAFVDGWFRTGDLGSCDEDGYLTINGRLKEMINRGGEKIAPVEVDDVLLQHRAVAQALTFALPHSLLGEEVAALIVPREGAMVTEKELKKHVSDRLAAYKVPKQVIIVDSIPLGKTGKPQRIGMAERLGLG